MRFLVVKLVEFLIAVVIIGTISITGLYMYKGVSDSAKSNSAKTNHNTVVKYITLELMRCETTKTVMDGNLTCPRKTATSVKEATIKALSHFKNPYGKGANDLNDTLITNGGTYTKDYDLGYVRLNLYEDSDQSTQLLIGTCYAIKCYTSKADNNFIVSYINIDDKINIATLQNKLKGLTQENLSDLSRKIEEVQKNDLTKKLLNLKKKFLPW